MDQAFTKIPTKKEVVDFYDIPDENVTKGVVVPMGDIAPDHEAHICDFPRLLLAPIKGVSQFACGHIVENSKVIGFEDQSDNPAMRND